MTTTQTIRIPYVVTTTVPEAGVEIVIQPAEREVPEYWDNVRIVVALHEDGTHCLATCGCVAPEDRTTIRRGETVTIGEWTWFGGQHSWLAGYRRIGPSVAELRLEARVDELTEDLAGEKILHGLTREDVAACEANIEGLKTRRAAIRTSLRRSRRATADAEHRFGLAFQAAWAGWSVAILIAALWVSAVIA
ncbi:hypothetical protein AB0K52_15190 [Glycomyces sp. NPDC049804]|uniref:hypothetical protein n=1 Tax=Glycomyces sp. NPDC049804 TaxID=3154363 RepID=UPI003423C2EB